MIHHKLKSLSATLQTFISSRWQFHIFFTKVPTRGKKCYKNSTVKVLTSDHLSTGARLDLKITWLKYCVICYFGKIMFIQWINSTTTLQMLKLAMFRLGSIWLSIISTAALAGREVVPQMICPSFRRRYERERSQDPTTWRSKIRER